MVRSHAGALVLVGRADDVRGRGGAKPWAAAASIKDSTRATPREVVCVRGLLRIHIVRSGRSMRAPAHTWLPDQFGRASMAHARRPIPTFKQFLAAPASSASVHTRTHTQGRTTTQTDTPTHTHIHTHTHARTHELQRARRSRQRRGFTWSSQRHWQHPTAAVLLQLRVDLVPVVEPRCLDRRLVAR